MCFSEKKTKNKNKSPGPGLEFCDQMAASFFNGCYAKEHGMEKRQPACKSTSVWFLFKDEVSEHPP